MPGAKRTARPFSCRKQPTRFWQHHCSGSGSARTHRRPLHEPDRITSCASMCTLVDGRRSAAWREPATEIVILLTPGNAGPKQRMGEAMVEIFHSTSGPADAHGEAERCAWGRISLFLPRGSIAWLTPALPLAGVSAGMERDCQQNGSSTAICCLAAVMSMQTASRCSSGFAPCCTAGTGRLSAMMLTTIDSTRPARVAKKSHSQDCMSLQRSGP